LWVEGTAPSAIAGDVVFRLNSVGLDCPQAEEGCDRVVMTAVRVDFAVEPDGFPGCPNGLLFDNFSNTVFISVEGLANPSNLVFHFCAYPEENGQLKNK
jgi:hypothetical protein